MSSSSSNKVTAGGAPVPPSVSAASGAAAMPYQQPYPASRERPAEQPELDREIVPPRGREVDENVNNGENKSEHPENNKMVPFKIGQPTTVTQAVPSTTGNKMEYVCVCSYTKIDNLAHQPKGTPADHTMTVFGLCHESGRLTKLFVTADMDKELQNTAFVRSHPNKNVLYAVTESINDNGWLFAFRLCPVSGQLREVGKVSTHGRSACFITLSRDLRYLLVINYWDSTMASIPIDEEGLFLTNQLSVKKNQIPGNNASKDRTAHGNDPHSKHRFAESHAHACVFDPAFGKMAFVPDLGEGVIKQFVFDENNGAAKYCGTIDCGKEAGPRYLEFHPKLDVCYVVNELSSSVLVFRFDELRVQEAFENAVLQPNNTNFQPALDKVQEISTLPEAFPKKLNTCGRICVDPSGKWVLVSNRGHDSIAVYPINKQTGKLCNAKYHHTGGFTPRHFKFSTNGNFLFSANQDSNCVCVFAFNSRSGDLTYLRSYDVKSPNFIEVKKPSSSRKLAAWMYARM
ncbi:unnamed protein product [Amoebophrya sp. A120]|nr:unnamed protein product [Amoebophrya sp. A120]|eukprot:GSA120T00008415001.1